MQCWRRARNVDVRVALWIPPDVGVAVAVAVAPENVPYTAYLLVYAALRYAYLLVYAACSAVAPKNVPYTAYLLVYGALRYWCMRHYAPSV